MQQWMIQPGGCLRGVFRVPGDKSISHRAIILSAIAEGISEISGFLAAQDTLATFRVMQELGVDIQHDETTVTVKGVGLRGLQAPTAILDCGNSGTGIRLLAGLLAGQSFTTTLTGDASLCRRPMDRIVAPLQRMGARIDSAKEQRAPLIIHGGQALKGIHYTLPMASAQVKSSLLLASIYTQGTTTISQPAITRDHTERLLQAFGYPIKMHAQDICIEGGKPLKATQVKIPADLSSAAFFLVGASITPDSDITLTDVGINPTRTGLIDLLRAMGADITLNNTRQFGTEPVADIRIRSAPLRGIDIPAESVPLAIDEFPALFIAAACAQGVTQLHGAAELRVKESDRIHSMAKGLAKLGIHVQEYADGLQVHGGTLQGGMVNSDGDHRVAMAFAIAGLRAQEKVFIQDCGNVLTSFPNFVGLAREMGLRLHKGIEI